MIFDVIHTLNANIEKQVFNIKDIKYHLLLGM